MDDRRALRTQAPFISQISFFPASRRDAVIAAWPASVSSAPASHQNSRYHMTNSGFIKTDHVCAGLYSSCCSYRLSPQARILSTPVKTPWAIRRLFRCLFHVNRLCVCCLASGLSSDIFRSGPLEQGMVTDQSGIIVLLSLHECNFPSSGPHRYTVGALSACSCKTNQRTDG